MMTSPIQFSSVTSQVKASAPQNVKASTPASNSSDAFTSVRFGANTQAPKKGFLGKIGDSIAYAFKYVGNAIRSVLNSVFGLVGITWFAKKDTSTSQTQTKSAASASKGDSKPAETAAPEADPTASQRISLPIIELPIAPAGDAATEESAQPTRISLPVIDVSSDTAASTESVAQADPPTVTTEVPATETTTTDSYSTYITLAEQRAASTPDLQGHILGTLGARSQFTQGGNVSAEALQQEIGLVDEILAGKRDDLLILDKKADGQTGPSDTEQAGLAAYSQKLKAALPQ